MTKNIKNKEQTKTEHKKNNFFCRKIKIHITKGYKHLCNVNKVKYNFFLYDNDNKITSHILIWKAI